MDQIVPRWEWRTFGQDFGPAEARFAASPRKNPEERRGLPAGRRVRRQRQDPRTTSRHQILERVNRDGLEQWRPVLKEPFPLEAAAIDRSHGELGLSR